jgi:hypothetical protein
MRKIERLLGTVLTKYPELKDYTFLIKYASLPDAYAESEIESLNIEVGINLVEPRKSSFNMANSENIKIQIDNTLRNKKDALKVAAIASEISHIVNE